MSKNNNAVNAVMMPEKMALTKLPNAIRKPIDIFICCASYESRSMSAAKAIGVENIKIPVVATNVNLATIVRENTDELLAYFGSKVKCVSMDSSNPLRTGDAIKDVFLEIKSEKPLNYLIDITTFTHESLLILLRLLASFLKTSDTANCVYVGAKDYSVDDSDENKWLTKGVEDVRSVLGYPGEMSPTKPIHLIIMVGFEHERAACLIREIDPDLISLGCGKSGTESDPRHASANKHFHNLLKTITSTYGKVSDFEFSCTDPISTKDALLRCVDSYPGYNVIIAPMNTKVSTIGAALAVFKNKEIQLCCSQPMHYNYSRYSIPSENCYLFNLNRILA